MTDRATPAGEREGDALLRYYRERRDHYAAIGNVAAYLRADGRVKQHERELLKKELTDVR